jgi:hypothetical protein
MVSGYMNTTVGRLWKQWPAQAERDGRAVVRIDALLLGAEPRPFHARVPRRGALALGGGVRNTSIASANED